MTRTDLNFSGLQMRRTGIGSSAISVSVTTLLNVCGQYDLINGMWLDVDPILKKTKLALDQAQAWHSKPTVGEESREVSKNINSHIKLPRISRKLFHQQNTYVPSTATLWHPKSVLNAIQDFYSNSSGAKYWSSLCGLQKSLWFCRP